MILTMLKSKIHRATTTGCNLSYEGSITIDPILIEAANMLPYEQVDVLNITNGARFTTYIIQSKKPGGGEVTINGAAARLVQPGDLVIVCAYAQMSEEEAKKYEPKVVLVDEKNRIKKY